MKFQIINVMWGENYIKTFLELSLPTQFSTGNLFDLKTKPSYVIYTNKEGKKQIQSSPIYQSLESTCTVDFRLIHLKKGWCPFGMMMKCQKHSIKESKKSKSPLVFLAPDCILSSGVFCYIEDALNKGVRLIAICSSRMSLESYREVIKTKEGKDEIVDWDSKSLAKITVKNLHHRAKCLIMKENQISNHPSHMYWQLDENNLFGKAYHLHPLLIWPRNLNVLPKFSIDGKKFLEEICPNFEEWEVITDCSKISLFEVSSNKQFQDDFTLPLDKITFNEWLKHNVSDSHHFFFKHQIILGDGNWKPEWDKVIEQALLQIKRLSTLPPRPVTRSPLVKKRFKWSFRLKWSFRFKWSFLQFFKWYGTLFYYIIIGRKKVTIKKIKYHFRYLLVHKRFPTHTLKRPP